MSISEDVAKLSPKQRALLEQLLAKEGIAASQLPIAPQKRETTSLPLSFAQQRLWFFDQWQPGNAVYNISRAIRLTGRLNKAALEQSLQEIVKRHEILRTTFTTLDGSPTQVIAPEQQVRLSITSLREYPQTQWEDEIQRRIIEEAHRPFDLARGPLMRTRVLSLAEHEHVFLLTMHHIISDGWSINLFLQEMSALYNAFTSGRPSPLLSLPIQYADFALWQRRWLSGEALKTQLDYWKRQLEDAPAVLQLPTDQPRSQFPTFRGATHTFGLSAKLSERLNALCMREGATLFMALLAAFQILLARYSGQEKVVVGTSIANRTRTEIENLIGTFFNTLALATDLSGAPSFREVLRRVRSMTLDAYAHQDLPLEQLVDALHPERTLQHRPLFQVLFELENVPKSDLNLRGLIAEALPIESNVAKFDLALAMMNTADGLQGALEYNTDLFHAETVARMMEHLRTLIEGMVAHPDRCIADLPLLTDVEQHELLDTRNQTTTSYPANQCFHELFEAQVARTPAVVAVEYAGERGACLTYEELDKRANQLAHHLRKLGIGPGTCVGICMERAPELLVGLLGIFKAGAAFLPLERAFPRERLAFMLADAQVTLLLTQRRLLEHLPVNDMQVLCLDAMDEVLALECDKQPVSLVTAEHLAYIIYTSGSTGKPKGVMVSHRGLVNYLVWCMDAYSAAAGSGAPVQSSIAADAIFPSLFAPLLTGTRVVLLPESHALEALSTVLQEQRDFSLIKITPSQLEVLNQQLPQADARGWVHTMVVGAEALRGDILEFWQKYAPDTILLNEYGPTETVVGCSIYQVPPGKASVGAVPIGLPIANTRFYILNSHLHPVSIGVAGELYIGGDGVAWGYLNRPTLTAIAFIPDPFSSQPGARLYKTGDLARYLPDRAANIEFLGRIDQQVKIRGYRVELGEVEATLAEHQAVDQVVVIAREDVPGVKQLIAYIILLPEEKTPASELRSFLEQKLPGYMVPSAFVFLDTLPLKATGKVDLSALPAPEKTRPGEREAFALPLTPVEKRLAEIWCDVLSLELVGIHDNFFEIGGDSILSIRIIARAQSAGIRITPKQMFQYQTIAELAGAAGVGATLTETEEEVFSTGIVPLTPVQHWFFEHDFPDRHHYNHATLLEMAPDIIDAELVQEAIQAVMQQHDVLRLRYTEGPQGWQQHIVADSGAIPFTFLDLALYSEIEQERQFEEAVAETQVSLDLAQGPLIRVVLFSFGQHKPGRLLIVIHHLAVDIVSWQILLGDLQTAYQQLLNGQRIHLPRKTTSFKSWAERLFDYAQSLRQEASYWMALPWAEVKRLPTDKDGANTQASARAVLVSLNEDETQALLREVPKRYRTQANDVLLTALQQAFAAWTGTQTLLVDLEGHGREDILEGADLSRTVGWFTSIVPVLLHIDKADSEPGETLKAVKEHLRAIPNGGIGFGLLRHLYQDKEIAEQLHTLPAAEIIFNYQGRSARALSRETLFTPSQASSGLPVSLRGIRSHLLSINAGVIDGSLYVEWTYSENVHHNSTVERLAQLYLEALRSLIRQSRSTETASYTPSDFPEAGLNQNELDSLIASLDY